jgi:CubicO group peptidase (beta-lactamase class C family)
MKDLFLSIIFCVGIFSLEILIAQTKEKANDNFSPKIDSIFSVWQQPNSPGGVVAVVQNEQIIFKKGYGLANISQKTPNTPQTQFNLASIAKQFTAMCIVLLEEQGKLSLNDNIQKYFPEFQFQEKITIHHLLTHTSGLREAYVLATLSGKINLKGEVRRKYNTVENMVALIARQKDLNFAPGNEHAYTNVNFILLGEIVRKVSGMSLRDFAERYIFQPLQMKNTYFNDKTATITPQRAIGYQIKSKQKFKATRLDDRGIVGDHNVISTLDDLILWQANFFDNQLGKKSSELIEKMQTRFILNNGDTISYGLGLNVSDYKNHFSVGHGGDDYRFTSFMVRFPKEKLSIICLSNQNNYETTQNGVFAIADLFLNVSPKTDSAKKQYKFIDLDKNYFANKVGNYQGIEKKNAFWFHQIHFIENKPYWSFGYNNLKHKKEIQALDNQHFVVKIDEPNNYLEIWFSKNDKGEILLHEKFKNDTLDFKQSKLVNFDKNDLKKFAGVYKNPEINSRMKVKIRKNNLLLVFRSIIKIKTIPMNENTFYAFNNQAYIRFRADEKGQIKDFVIDANDFRNFKFIK